MGLCARVGLVREKVLLMHLEVGSMLFREEGLARGSAFFLSPQKAVCRSSDGAIQHAACGLSESPLL